MLFYKNKKIETDHDGYLKNIHLWNRSIALLLARQENIILTKHHWKIIFFVRSFYLQYNIFPNIRILIKAISDKYGDFIGNSSYLYFLFPNSPTRIIAKLAGLPKPIKCI